MTKTVEVVDDVVGVLVTTRRYAGGGAMQRSAYPSTTTICKTPSHAACRRSRAILAPLRGGYMHSAAYGLPRIYIPRTRVNKGKNKGRGVAASALRGRSVRLP